MSWPTTKQIDDAAELGSNQALAEIKSGAEEPHEAPLSGEWADEMSPSMIAASVGYKGMSDGAVDELADAFERCYFDTWEHESSVKAEEDAE